jgi:hypothetical protein
LHPLRRMHLRMQGQKIVERPKMKLLKPALLSTLLLSSASLFAQWECPSRIGGNLKPFTETLPNLTWAGELTTTAGSTGDYAIGNLMGFGALDYSTDKTTFYLEGGVKSWKRLDFNGYHNEGHNFGLREAFFQYRGTSNTLNLGLRSTQGDDHYLINERVMGIDFKQTLGNWNLRAVTGSVMNRFARNGTFCTLGYLYNIVPGRERALLGRQFGQTNLAMLTLNYRPGSKPSTSDEFASSDGLSTPNEFAATDEFATSAKKPAQSLVKLVNAGALAYTEYGVLIATKALYSGLYAEVEVAGITLKPEIILQSASGNQGLIYNLTAQKQITWSNQQQTKIFGRYIGMIQIDSAAHALNSFSNVFAGEVLRLDANELPIFQCGIKHSVPSLQASLKLQAALQTGETRGYQHNIMLPPPTVGRMEEYDMVLSKNFGDHFLLNAHLGYLVYPKMTSVYNYVTNKTPWGKLEMRITF